MMWDLERESVAWRLARAGIPAVLLKGAALRLSTYRDSAERAFGDLDVLVPRESIPAAVSALEAAGYERESERRVTLYLEHHHHLILTKPEGLVVEVPWALDAPASPFRLDPAAFIRAARQVGSSGSTTFQTVRATASISSLPSITRNRLGSAAAIWK